MTTIEIFDDPEQVSARMEIWCLDCKEIGYSPDKCVKCPHCKTLQLVRRPACGNKLCKKPVAHDEWLPDQVKESKPHHDDPQDRFVKTEIQTTEEPDEDKSFWEDFGL